MTILSLFSNKIVQELIDELLKFDSVTVIKKSHQKYFRGIFKKQKFFEVNLIKKNVLKAF